MASESVRRRSKFRTSCPSISIHGIEAQTDRPAALFKFHTRIVDGPHPPPLKLLAFTRPCASDRSSLSEEECLTETVLQHHASYEQAGVTRDGRRRRWRWRRRRGRRRHKGGARFEENRMCENHVVGLKWLANGGLLDGTRDDKRPLDLAERCASIGRKLRGDTGQQSGIEH